MRGFQGRDRLLARDGREVIQELVEAVAAFQIIDEIAQRYPRAYEDRSASEDFGIAVDDRYLL